MRKAGILMPVASLPGRFGIGTFGNETYHFIDMIHEVGLKVWQILPLNPLGYGNSPYQPYSSYAMDPLYISLDLLYEQGLLEKKAPSFQRRHSEIDYVAVRKFKEIYLRKAFKNFKPDHNYSVFAYQEWVKQYAIFMTFKQANESRCWNEWPVDMRDQPINGNVDLKPYEDEILYQVFLQYELFLQWKNIKQYANDCGIEIMGDIPFYVGLDSADVWASRENFLLDDDGHPIFIAGVPPDYFSATGQRWGNPIYNWEYMQQNQFNFWVERLSYMQRMFDYVRVDHFRAFDTYWKIIATCPTAVEGEWIEAPGYALFDTLFDKNPEMQIVAEDLGDLREEVHTLRNHYDFRGMRVIQFSFDPNGMGEDREHLLVYTGTHDNAPIYSWYKEKSRKEQRDMRHYLYTHGYQSNSFVKDILAYSLDSNADLAIIPIADWLHLGSNARLNTPGTVGSPNWMWRMVDYSNLNQHLQEMKELVKNSNR